MKTTFHLFTAAVALLLSQATVHAANDLLEWRHDFVSGLTPNSRGVDVAMNNKGSIASIAYTTTGADEKWFITRHDNFTGTVMWQKTIAVSGQDCRPVAAVMDEYGRIFVTGYVGGANGRDISTYCFAKDGTQSWSHTFNGAGNGHDQPTALALDSDGNVIITGTTTGSSVNVITLRLNANSGSEMWSQIYSTIYEDVPAAISCSPYGGFIIVAGKSRTGSTACSLVLRYDQDTGTVTPNIINDAAKDDEATDVITDGAAAIYIARRIRNSASNYTAAISRVDQAGGAMWTHTYDAPGINASVNPRIGYMFRSQSPPDAVLCCESRIDAQREGCHIERWKSDGTSVWDKDTITSASPVNSYERLQGMAMTYDRQISLITSNATPTASASQLQALRIDTDGVIRSRQSFSANYTGSSVVGGRVATNRLGQAAFIGTATNTAVGIEDFLIARTAKLFLSPGDPVTHALLSSSAVLLAARAPAIGHFEALAARVTIKDGPRILQGIWTSGSIGALQGQSVPGITGAKFVSFGDPIENFGGLCFTARISGVPASQSLVVCKYLSGGPIVILQTGKPVPGTNGALLGSLLSHDYCHYGLVALVRLAGPGVTAANSLALVAAEDSSTGLTLLRAGENLTVNGTTSAVRGIQIFTPSVKSPGQGRAVGTLQKCVAASATLADGRSVLVHYDLNTTMRTLQLVSGGSAIAVSASAQWRGFGQPSMGYWSNEQAAIATLKPGLGGVTKANDTAIIAPTTAGGGGAWMVVAREGGAAPGLANTKVRSLYPPVTDNSNVAFMATFTGTGITKYNNAALWYGPRATPQLVMRTGMFAPDGTGANSTNTISSIRSFAVPNWHPTFIATLRGKVITAANNIALYGLDSDGLVRELLRKGQLFGTAKLSSFDLFRVMPGIMGSTRSFNDDATFAMQVRLNDGRQGVLLRRVP